MKVDCRPGQVRVIGSVRAERQRRIRPARRRRRRRPAQRQPTFRTSSQRPQRRRGLPGPGHRHRGMNKSHVRNPDRERIRRDRRHPRVPDGPRRALPVRAAAADARDERDQTAFPGADLERQHAVADHRTRGGARAVRRLAGQRRRPARRLPALERAHALHGEQAAAVGVHLRRRGAHPVPPDAVQAVHLQARRGPAPGHPGGHRRVHRRDPGRPAARRHRREARAAGADQGDQRDARRALRRPRVLPGARQRRAGPLRRPRTPCRRAR